MRCVLRMTFQGHVVTSDLEPTHYHQAQNFLHCACVPCTNVYLHYSRACLHIYTCIYVGIRDVAGWQLMIGEPCQSCVNQLAAVFFFRTTAPGIAACARRASRIFSAGGTECSLVVECCWLCRSLEGGTHQTMAFLALGPCLRYFGVIQPNTYAYALVPTIIKATDRVFFSFPLLLKDVK